MCGEVGCVENQREAAALLCALAVPHENKLPLAESDSAEPLMLMCQSSDVEVGWVYGLRYWQLCLSGYLYTRLDS